MTPRVSHRGTLGRIGLFLFGLVFLGAGLAMGYFFVFADVSAAIAARGYVPVQAELLHVELKRHQGDKSTTYETKARYQYTYEGRTFTSQRVGIGEGADNIGSYQQELYRKLNTAKQRRMNVTAWVNPRDANEAVLDRDMRWGLFALKGMFFLVFTAVGFGIAVFAIRATAETPAPVDKPWLANPAWRDGRITSGSRAGVIGMWAMAILWNAISAPLAFIMPAELAKENWLALIGFLFPLAGAWLLYVAIHKTLQWRRFGALVLTMQPFPGAVGGQVGGAVELPERFRPGQRFRVSLTCVHRRVSGNRDRDVSESAIWQNEIMAPVEMSGRGSRVGFRFSVPANLPPTGAPSDDYHYWTVHLQAELDGVDLDHTFDVPLAPAAESASTSTTTTPITPAAAAPEIPANIVRIERRAGATVFYYPLFRYPSLGIGLVLFSLIFGGSAVFLFSEAKGLTGILAGFMGVVFAAAAASLLLFGLYCLGNTLRVEVSPRGLTTIRRVFGVGFTTHVPLDEISGIEPKIGSQSKSGAKFSVRYALHALRYAGRRVAVGDDIPGQPLADHLATLLREACGIRPAQP
jgi:hypothetical protein